MRSIDALEPMDKTDTSKEIIINEDTTTKAIGELNVNLKNMTDSTKESIENFQNAIKKMTERMFQYTTSTPTPTETETTPKGDNE